MPDSNQYARLVTQRFLAEMDRIIDRKEGNKVTAEGFSKIVGINRSNLNRLRSGKNNYVTVENCCLLIENYGTAAVWLMTGRDPMDLNYEITNKQIQKLEERVLHHAILIDCLFKELKSGTLKKNGENFN